MDDRAQRFHVASRMASIEPFEVMEIQTLARAARGAGPRRDPPGDRRAGLPHARTRSWRPPSARSTRSRMYYTSALGLPALREAIVALLPRRATASRCRRSASSSPRARAPRCCSPSACCSTRATRCCSPTRAIPATGTSCARWAACRGSFPWGADSRYQLTPELARAPGRRARAWPWWRAPPIPPARWWSRTRSPRWRRSRARRGGDAPGGRDLPRPHLRPRRAHRARGGRRRLRRQQLLEVFPDDGMAAGLARARRRRTCARSRSSRRTSTSRRRRWRSTRRSPAFEPGDDRDPRGAPPRARRAARLPAAGARVPGLSHPGDARRARSTSTRTAPPSTATASRSRARVLENAGVAITPGKDFGSARAGAAHPHRLHAARRAPARRPWPACATISAPGA